MSRRWTKSQRSYKQPAANRCKRFDSVATGTWPTQSEDNASKLSTCSRSVRLRLFGKLPCNAARSNAKRNLFRVSLLHFPISNGWTSHVPTALRRYFTFVIRASCSLTKQVLPRAKSQTVEHQTPSFTFARSARSNESTIA